MMKRRNPQKPSNFSYLLAGGSMLMLVGVMVEVRSVVRPAAAKSMCSEIVQPASVLPRDKLALLLNVPERDSKDTIRAIISEPYCRLPTVEIRAGVTDEREAYPLAFDPQTWFVVLYEGNEYAGYDFVFNP